MDDERAVLLEYQGAVAVISINRPLQRNTLTLDVLIGLSRALREIADLGSVRAVVLAGEGRDFSLGGDQGDFMEAISLSAVEATKFCTMRTALLADIAVAIYSLTVPVVAAVNGQASGAGMSLALACDIRVMDQRAKFHFAYRAIGASTDGGMSWFLPRLIGEARAMHMLLFQPVVRAREAQEIGLASEISPPGEARMRALEMATELAISSPHAIQSAKRNLREQFTSELRRHLELEHQAFVAGVMTREFRDAVGARKAEAQGFEVR